MSIVRKGFAMAALACAMALLPAAAPPAAAQAAAEAEKPFELQGFRSARFGMSEAEVRGAIEKDFRLKGEAVKAGENALERTRNLTVRVPNLIEGGGTADVAYVFGHKSRKLIQVALAWSKETDAAMTAERLVSNANFLAAALAQSGYRPDSVRRGVAAADGSLIVFSGTDARGRVAVALLQGETKAGAKEGERTMTPARLNLFYIADPEKPDIFKIAPGQF